jgi:hypothetical protein
MRGLRAEILTAEPLSGPDVSQGRPSFGAVTAALRGACQLALQPECALLLATGQHW